jgi:hypothetical protein
MKRVSRLGVLLIVFLSLAYSLGVAVGQTAESGKFAGLVDIGSGRKMYLKCSGNGSPTVVLVGGFRASAHDWTISDKSRDSLLLSRFLQCCCSGARSSTFQWSVAFKSEQ